MKFGEIYTEYLHAGDRGGGRFDPSKYSHVEYKRLKKVLKICRYCRDSDDPSSNVGGCEGVGGGEFEEDDRNDKASDVCRYQSCQWCDQMFFSELMDEASNIAGCVSLKVRQLVNLRCTSGLQRHLLHLFQCFKKDDGALVDEGRMLIEYVIMNGIALRKILKKYDKVHNSVNGMNFKSRLRAKHLEILQSPWLIELVAFYMNYNESNNVISDDLRGPFTCDLRITESEPVLTLTLPDSAKLEYSLTCAVCLDTVFHPYALSCGHLFCKSCACFSASVLVLEGIQSASPRKKCPVCREGGVFADAVRMTELDLLLKRRCKELWKERLAEERAKVLKQTKEFWESQSRYIVGI